MECMRRIKTAARKYLPFIELETFEVAYDNRDSKPSLATLIIMIAYGIPSIGVTGKKMQVMIAAGG